MTSLDDYEVLGILGTNLHSTCYKVKHKKSSSVYVWKAVSYESHGLDSKSVIDKVNKRKEAVHPYLLPVHDFIHHEDTNTIYLVTEFCKHGSLLDLLHKCKQNGEYLDEDFIWNTLYKLSCFYKISGASAFNLHEIFIDSDFNLKIFDFTLAENKKPNNNLHNLTNILKQIVYLKGVFPGYYSNELKSLIKFLLEPEPGIQPTVDAILCHPAVLTKISIQKDSIFVKDPETRVAVPGVQNWELVYQSKLESLRNREASLKKNEERLMERSLALDKREKRVVLSERMAREKMLKAELYLKRARDMRSSTVGSSKGSLTTKKEILDSIDVSYSPECGDGSILPTTSCKLNIQEIAKPNRFTRTLSERRVRFKSHSPLKEIHNYKRESRKAHQEFPKPAKLDTIHQSDSDKASETNSEKSKKKFLLSGVFSRKPSLKKPSSVGSSSDSVSVHTYEDIDKGWNDLEDCKPINWTVESKRQAFDLLRIMNGEENVEQIKHTFL